MKNFSFPPFKSLACLFFACLCLRGLAQSGPQPVPATPGNPGGAGPVNGAQQSFNPPAMPGNPKPGASGADMVGPITLHDDSIDQVLALLERWTGKTILRPQALPNNSVTFSFKGSIPRDEAIRALETQLAMAGVAVAPLDDRFLKVGPLSSIRSEAPELIEGSTLGLAPSGRLAQKLFQLSFFRVGEFMPQISGLLNPNIASPPVVFEKANAALITDSITNLQRIETLVSRLDKPLLSGLQTRFYTLQGGGKASDLVNKMRTVLTGSLLTQIGTSTSINADDRTNQIILIADPAQYPFFDDLIAKLDIKSDPNTRNEVIYLLHAAAKDVADILAKLISGQNTASKASGQDNITRALQAPGAPPLPAGATPPGTAPATPAAVAAAVQGLDSGINQFSAICTVLSDERSNSLVVSGTVDDIRLIRDLVAKIDVLLSQVRIEVIIAEVTLTDTDQSGITALNLTAKTTPVVNAAGATVGGKFAITNFDGKFGGWSVSSGVVNPLSFAASLADNGSKSHVRILSAPTIVTSHNKQAEVVVGQSQPVITGSTATPTSASTTGITTQSQVTYKNIAIDLKVTPLIGDDGTVQMTIDQIVDDVLGNVTIDGNSQPIIGHREATSFVTVRNDQMIVLGGLQRTKKSADRTKVGFLYEIPIISQLLGGHTNTQERTELLLFIRPHVLKPDETSFDTDQKINEQSNKTQIKQFLKDPNPDKQPKDSLLDKLN